MVVSPFIADKRWTKRKVIEMFNQSHNARDLDVAYSDRELSAKRFDRIMAEIVHMLQKPNNVMQSAHPSCLSFRTNGENGDLLF
jgi:hypothetical protein